MGYHQTQTSKEILSNEEALRLSFKLKNVLKSNTIDFAQALYETATPLLVIELETLLAVAGHLSNLDFVTEDEAKTKKYLMDSIRL